MGGLFYIETLPLYIYPVLRITEMYLYKKTDDIFQKRMKRLQNCIKNLKKMAQNPLQNFSKPV